MFEKEKTINFWLKIWTKDVKNQGNADSVHGP